MSQELDHTFCLQRVLVVFVLRDVHDAVHIERDFLRAGRPTLVAEAVLVLAVGVRGEGVVFGGDCGFVVLAIPDGVLDLQ